MLASTLLARSSADATSSTPSSPGRYSITSDRVASAIRAKKDGYEAADVSVGALSGATFVTNVRMRRYDRYALVAPTSLKVGQVDRLRAQVDLDDGSRLIGLYLSTTSSSNAFVLSVERPAYTGLVRALTPGVVTVTSTFAGLSSAPQIVVD